MKVASLVAVLITLANLTACTRATQPPKSGESFVELQTQAGDEMIARRIDSAQAKSLDHFSVSPGNHTLELGIVIAGYQNSNRRCIATLAYKDFAPDHHYTLQQSRSDREVKVVLVDSRGLNVAQAGKVACL